MTADTTLAPCPFCGGVGITLSVSRQHGHGESWEYGHARCSGCGASFTVGGDYAGARTEQDLKELAAKRWNRRAQAPAPQGPALVPLKDAQAKAALWAEHLRWMEAAGLDTEGMRPTGEWLDHWLNYVRAIETAHGITGAPNDKPT